MPPVNFYWISRDGAAPEGPFLKSQIAAKWKHRQLRETDLLCEDGTSDWQEAAQIISSLGIDPTQTRQRPRH